jgi:microcystin-dependent protein
MPAHAHTINAKNASADENVGGRTPSPSVVLAEGIAALPNQQTASVNIYGTGGPNRALAPATVTNAGGSQPHENRQPYLVLNVCIALQGVFPSPH